MNIKIYYCTYCEVDMTVLVECAVSVLSFVSDTERCKYPAAVETVVVARLRVLPNGAAEKINGISVQEINFSCK